MQVKLSHDIAIRCAHQSSGVFKVFINEDNATCVLTQATNQTFNLLSDLPDFGIVFCHFIHKLLIRREVTFFIAVKSLVKSSQHTTVRSNHRCQILCDIDINTQTTTSSQDSRFRFFSTECRNVGNSVFSINLS